MMTDHDNHHRDDLFALYTELHQACERAAAALRFPDNGDASEQEMLARFRLEEATAARIWARIIELRQNRDQAP
jgi:hypothetical protein